MRSVRTPLIPRVGGPPKWLSQHPSVAFCTAHHYHKGSGGQFYCPLLFSNPSIMEIVILTKNQKKQASLSGHPLYLLGKLKGGTACGVCALLSFPESGVRQNGFLNTLL